MRSPEGGWGPPQSEAKGFVGDADSLASCAVLLDSAAFELAAAESGRLGVIC